MASTAPRLMSRRRRRAPEREIDPHPDLVAMLKKHKQGAVARRQAGASDFVTCTAEGKPLYYRNALRDRGGG